jgi:hypothetical protein
MKRVVVFGNTGAGKSTLARRLAELTGLALDTLDLIQFKSGGDPRGVISDEQALRPAVRKGGPTVPCSLSCKLDRRAGRSAPCTSRRAFRAGTFWWPPRIGFHAHSHLWLIPARCDWWVDQR